MTQPFENLPLGEQKLFSSLDAEIEKMAEGEELRHFEEERLKVEEMMKDPTTQLEEV